MFVITGAGGFLGSYLIKTILEKTDEDIVACARTADVYCRDNDRVRILMGDLKNDDYISAVADEINKGENVKLIYTAACHNIDFVAANPEEAYYMNITVPEKLLEKVIKCDRIFFASSDTVYGEGAAHAFTEEDELKPVSIYGEQKAEAEGLFIKKGGTALRLPLMFSYSISPSKKHFCDVVRDNIINKKETMLVTGAVRSTLDYATVADIIIRLCSCEDLPYVINIGGDEPLSKYELGLRLAQSMNADTDSIIPVKAFGAEAAEGAKRADSTILSNKRLKELLGPDEIKIRLQVIE